ncbi:MAG: FAD-binding oxidoreductase [Bdellovibrionaceae bacterium]|nr:FAD-binding oxidoreductase [Pseudobdellovibrionaceae bacterium]
MNISIASVALEELCSIVGPDRLETDPAILNGLTRNTLNTSRRIVARIQPTHQDQVQSILKVATQHRLAIYTISTGKNWGYGGAAPVVQNCLLLDLSRLKSIIHFNSELGYVTVEPGVTQQDLYEFLEKNEAAFMVPTTGAGPTASLLGNALERGYGITPHEDHFGAVLGIKALLPDGTLYQSTLKELGGHLSDSVFKWKIGPYLDGLFTQSNLGIVLEATLALARRPEDITQFTAFLDDSNLENAIRSTARIRQTFPGLVGGINIINRRRLLSMMENDWPLDQVLDESELHDLAKKRGLHDWALIGAVYGPPSVTRPTTKWIRRELKSCSKLVISLNRKKLSLARRIINFIPNARLQKMLSTAGHAMDILEGRPNSVALPLAYLKNPVRPTSTLNPDQDDCGLIWFAPLIPIQPQLVRQFCKLATSICIRHQIEPLITLTAISERCFDATLPLLYSKQSASGHRRAELCLHELLVMARSMGLFPYRLDIERLAAFHSEAAPAFDLIRTIKRAMDPNGILSPGRYD